MKDAKFEMLSSDTMLGLVKMMNNYNLDSEDIVYVTHADNQFFLIYKN